MRQKKVGAWRRAAVRYPALPAMKRRLSGITLGITRFVYSVRGRTGVADTGALGLDPANITWIFCVGRSGSTWLSNVMGELGGPKIWREPKIGQLFGNRDHTTVMYAYKKISDLMKERRSIYNQVSEITAQLGRNSR